jgi:3-oxoacyl-[acyl-carrier protein] reductase
MPPHNPEPYIPNKPLLDGKVAIVTGAGRGIGSEIARVFAAEGAHVVVHYHASRDGADKIAAEIGNGAVVAQADLSDPAQAERLVREAHDAFGRVDILVNTAASFAHDLTFETATWDDYLKEFSGVVGATVNPTKAVIPLMKEAGGGRIVNFVATLVQRPAAEYIVHTTAKSALIGYTRTLARDIGRYGITVNMISPGMTLTEFSRSLPQAVQDSVAKQTPLRRLAGSEDVARVVLFYASPLADFVTGANIAPDGGLAIL